MDQKQLTCSEDDHYAIPCDHNRLNCQQQAELFWLKIPLLLEDVPQATALGSSEVMQL